MLGVSTHMYALGGTSTHVCHLNIIYQWRDIRGKQQYICFPQGQRECMDTSKGDNCVFVWVGDYVHMFGSLGVLKDTFL